MDMWSARARVLFCYFSWVSRASLCTRSTRRGSLAVKLSRFSSGAQRVLLGARDRARANGRGAIGSEDLLAASLADDEVHALLGGLGIALPDQAAAPAEHLSKDALLHSIGIEVDRVRSLLPAAPDPSAWVRLHRRRLRPLEVRLTGLTTTARFSASGRKVLEVALWRARRDGRAASPLDVLAGILADGRDPVASAFATAAGTRLNRLVAVLYST